MLSDITRDTLSIMGNTLAKTAALDIGIQWGLFLIAAYFQTEKFYDLAGSGTFALLAYKSLQWGGKYFKRQKIQTAMVTVWAARLGFYLFTRILKEGSDSRFNHVRSNPKTFFIYWTVQALWIFITLLPTLIQNSKQEDTVISTREELGWGVWILGFLIEMVSDYQKSQFRSNPDNAGKFITSGLWSLSRHPNYLGEILAWIGLYISASKTLKGFEHMSVISPLFVTYLLTSVSGIPILERQGMKRWGQQPAYLDYLKKTAVLVPYLY